MRRLIFCSFHYTNPTTVERARSAVALERRQGPPPELGRPKQLVNLGRTHRHQRRWGICLGRRVSRLQPRQPTCFVKLPSGPCFSASRGDRAAIGTPKPSTEIPMWAVRIPSNVGGRPGKSGGVRNRQPRFARVALRGSVEGVGLGPLANAVRGDSVAFLAGPRNSLPTNRAAGCGPTKRQRRGRALRRSPTYRR